MIEPKPSLPLVAACALALFWPWVTPAAAESFEKLKLDGADVRYVVRLPPGYDPQRSYPTLLAMPPGAMNREAVAWGLQAFWGEAATTRGWIVVTPAVPGVDWTFWQRDEGETALAALLDEIASRHRIEGGKFHLAGCSNGGISAVHIALDAPHRFASLTTLPGHPRNQADFDRLERLRELEVRLLVGAGDEAWVGTAQRAAERLEELGGSVELETFPGEGHVIGALRNGGLMERLEALRSPEGASEAEKVAP